MYHMAIPAVKILEKYPSYVVVKPEVFRRPWDSVVRRREKILTPGQKFFLVLRQDDDFTVTSSAFRKRSGIVTFVGMDDKHKASSSSNSEKKGKSKKGTKKSSNSEWGGEKRTPWNAIAFVFF
ncbi:hypothetical protein P3X46_018054 [Hevea brasiliensis]|uniref:Uncharacterized protein n=1 Tax=Hevea brasiliensis TaxID=3981 RepID=A0ABQ9LRR2_HEVBR|nr:hypothetical protein P3X46_018054 [Hevea brasiliensis]